jgi:hypothetical protein
MKRLNSILAQLREFWQYFFDEAILFCIPDKFDAHI